MTKSMYEILIINEGMDVVIQFDSVEDAQKHYDTYLALNDAPELIELRRVEVLEYKIK